MRERARNLTAAEMMDAWKGKKVRIMNKAEELERGWEVVGTNTQPPQVIVVKLNEYHQIGQRRTVSWEEFSEWQKR